MNATPEAREERAGDPDVPALELADWKHRFGLRAGITTRAHGYNLGLSTPEAAAVVTERWRAFATVMRPQFPSIVVGMQVHGQAVAIHDQVPPGWLIRESVDGHVTRQRGLLLCVSVADCVPVYLAHPTSGTVALLHAGWRGIAGGMLEAGLGALQEASGGMPSEFVMHCGVAICGSCYEVGPEVLGALDDTGASGPGLLDLRKHLAGRARAAGVGAVSTSPWCSAHHPDRFFSHRRSGGADGRMVAYLGQPIA